VPIRIHPQEERIYVAELFRLKGELLLTRFAGNEAEAETCFQAVLAMARRQAAAAWELRAAMSLSRLWRRQDQPERARAMLAEIYSRFSEGIETPDLRDAMALLEPLP
jgi:predicted ATPase